MGAFQIWGNLQKTASNTDSAPVTSILTEWPTSAGGSASLSKDAVLGQKTAFSRPVTLSLSKRDYVQAIRPQS
jgi:hypothetical protein